MDTPGNKHAERQAHEVADGVQQRDNENGKRVKSCLRMSLSWFVILDAAACMPDISVCISGCTPDMEEWQKDVVHLSCVQHICICMCDCCCDSLQACFSRRSCRTRCAGHKHAIACKLFFTRHVLFCKTTCTILEVYLDYNVVSESG